ncbi:MAG TPA: glycoside hydrolase family 140 protein [Tepidisphaeraceae bacterium]|nr:glycoside hydrolase family 140 protein [Tepidisphaeraceae bacterium]
MRALKVSDNKRFLTYADGKPFFYLADTAWELFHRLDRAQTLRYLTDRAAKGFTVIQAVVLAEIDGLNTPNMQGHRPLHDNDPTRLDEAYFADVDWVVDTAASLGLYIGMLPTWGDKWNKKWGIGPEIFTPDNAYTFGLWLGRRYRDKPIIWITGGDRPVETDLHREIVTRMANGLRDGDGGRNLVSFHPTGGRASSEVFHAEPWLDFNMWQSGHGRNAANYEKISSDYDRRDPVKPVLDAEPGYEDHPSAFKLDNGYLDQYDVRKSLYWSLFAGACGYTYGCHPIWQFWQSGREPRGYCRTHWEDALHLPGSGQMRHARALLESRPFLSRVPDQSLIVSEQREGSHHQQATLDAKGRYAMIYCPYYDHPTIDLAKLSNRDPVAYWFDPRTGTAATTSPIKRQGNHATYPTPYGGPDWVLVLDDPACNFPRPGAAVTEIL